MKYKHDKLAIYLIVCIRMFIANDFAFEMFFNYKICII